MKKTAKRSNTGSPLALVLLLALASGCVPSLHPLYTEKDLVFDPALLGVWADPDADETWAFEKAEGQKYKLTYTEKGKKGEFEVALVKLGESRFLDFFPLRDALKDLDRNDLYKAHFQPTHTFARLTGIEPTLQMAFLDPSWLETHLKTNSTAIRHERVNEDGIILTASTAELQSFVTRLAQTPKAFGNPSQLRRKSSAPK